MPSCIVKGCKHHTSMKSSNPLLSMHVFPRELGRIKLWLQHTGQDFGDIDSFAAKILDAAKSGKYRICSAHFDPGCYTTLGCRLVLKHDAVPTIFPGVYPKPSPNWKPFSPQARKAQLDTIRMCPSGCHENVNVTKLLRKDAATQTNVGQDKVRPVSLNTSLMERCNQQEEIFDASGRLIGVFSPDSRQRDLKVRPGLWTYDWSTQIPKEPSRTHPPMENKEALSSLEKVLLSLLKHMAEAPHTRPQKQRTNRLLNRTAEIISILTGEEWTVVKKNAHISKFYQMIREVPIKCGDVAMFFTMDEWEYIEAHEELYKPMILENPKNDKDNAPHTGPGSSQDKAPASQQQTNANTDCSAGKKVTSETSLPPPPSSSDCHRMPLSPAPEKRSITPERAEQRRSFVSDTIRSATIHTEDKESLKKEKEEAGTSCRRTSTAAKDEEFIKKEDEDSDMADNSTDITTKPHGDPPPRKDPLPAEVVHRCIMRNDSCQSRQSELWIAEDGTTSSRFIPQEDSRPPGRIHKTYSRKPQHVHCAIKLSSGMAPDQTRSKRGNPENAHWCDECNDKCQLAAHQKLHTKKPRR